ncbi:MAG: hypothetical protein HUK08_08445, partial [Bacteroidaceae bacterium]|nr:hypothetical protein [Bacteroidaceae bacterium]
TNKNINGYENSFSAGCNSNTLAGNCTKNTFGEGCSYNTLANYCHRIKYGNVTTYTNLTEDYMTDIVFGGAATYVNIKGSGASPSSSAFCQNIVIAQGLKGTIASRHIITVARGLPYETHVGLPSTSNNPKTFCLADLVQ